MTNLHQNFIEKFTDANRKYWRLQEILPTEHEKLQLSSYFTLHKKEWRCAANLYDNFFSISLYFIDRDIAGQFNVQMGIFGESGENIAMSNATQVSDRHFDVIRLMPSSELHSVVQSNQLYIFFVEIEKKDENKQEAKVLKRKFEMDYREMLLSGKKSDFTINVKHRKFTCHALILGARSPVFSAMLEHEMKEKRNSEVFIPDADPAVFQCFLLYLYTGKEEYLNGEKITDLYKLGDKYCVDDLKYLCVEYMKTNMLVENFFEFFLVSEQHSDSELSTAAVEFFLENSGDIIESEKWTEFMKEYPKETCVLIKALQKCYAVCKGNVFC